METEFVTAVLAFLSAAAIFFIGKYHEKRSVNLAVLAEIQRLLIVLKSHRNWWDRSSVSGRNTPLIPFSVDVYRSQIDHVGVIDRYIVADVVRFYGYIEFLNRLQERRDEYRSSDDLDSFHQTYGRTLATVMEHFGSKFDGVFEAHGLS